MQIMYHPSHADLVTALYASIYKECICSHLLAEYFSWTSGRALLEVDFFLKATLIILWLIWTYHSKGNLMIFYLGIFMLVAPILFRRTSHFETG